MICYKSVVFELLILWFKDDHELIKIRLIIIVCLLDLENLENLENLEMRLDNLENQLFSIRKTMKLYISCFH